MAHLQFTLKCLAFPNAEKKRREKLRTLCPIPDLHTCQLGIYFSQPGCYMRSVPKCMLAHKLPNPVGRSHERARSMLGSLSHADVLFCYTDPGHSDVPMGPLQK
eukprot:1138352-Pelagomonas_calceolata.AAC.3